MANDDGSGSGRGQGIANNGSVRQQFNIQGNSSISFGAGATAAAGFTLGTVVTVGIGTYIAGIITTLLIVWFCAVLYDRYVARRGSEGVAK